jgi:hypothetical protein
MIAATLLLCIFQSETGVSIEDISKKISDISSRIAEMSSELTKWNIGELEILPEELVKKSDDLVTEMEALLEILPESDQSSSPQQQNTQSIQRPQENNLEPQQNQSEKENGQKNDNNKQGTEQPSPSWQSIIRLPQKFGDWGNLPPRLEQTLQLSSPQDMPLRYRHLLIKYHRQATAPDQ